MGHIPTEAQLREKIMHGKAVIIFIDVQNYFFQRPKHKQAKLIDVCKTVLKQASGKVSCLHIGYVDKKTAHDSRKVQHFRLSAPRYINGTGLSEKELRRMNLVSKFSYVIPKRHKIFLKSSNGAFDKTPHLKEQLEEHGIDTVILAGVNAGFCVRQTAIGAKKIGLNVVFLSDAIRCDQYVGRCSADDSIRLQIHRELFSGLGLVTTSQYLLDIMRSMPRSPQNQAFCKMKKHAALMPAAD